MVALEARLAVLIEAKVTFITGLVCSIFITCFAGTNGTDPSFAEDATLHVVPRVQAIDQVSETVCPTL